MTTELTPIKVVPHFMRPHEWIALEGGYYQDEGLEPVLMADVMHSVSGHRGEHYGVGRRTCPSSRRWRTWRTQPVPGARCAMPAPGWGGSSPTSTEPGASRPSPARRARIGA